MSDRKRRWLQIHLSTAIVLMLSVGVLLLVNARTHSHARPNICGWPFDAFAGSWSASNQLGVSHVARYSSRALAVNGFVATTILFSIAFFSECLIRSRQRAISKPEEATRRFWQFGLGTATL